MFRNLSNTNLAQFLDYLYWFTIFKSSISKYFHFNLKKKLICFDKKIR